MGNAVTRFVIEDSIEEDIHNQNSQARNALSTQGSHNPDAGTQPTYHIISYFTDELSIRET